MRRVVDCAIVCTVMLCSIIIFLFIDEIGTIGNLGYLGILVLCMISNMTICLPAPSLMVVVSYSQIHSPMLVALVGALGITIGEMVGYLFGGAISNISSKWEMLIQRISAKVKNIYILVFVFALLPLPLFDFIGVYAGSKKVKLPMFFIVCYVGKMLKVLFYAVFVGGIISNYITV